MGSPNRRPLSRVWGWKEGSRAAALAVGVSLGLAATPALAQTPLGDLSGMATCADLGRLTAWRTAQLSGYAAMSEAGDPQQAPAQDDQGRYVLLDVEGPGCVTRLWGAGLAGNLSVWIDDDAEPRLHAPLSSLTQRWWHVLRYQNDRSAADTTALPPFFSPLADGEFGMTVVVIPLGFRKHCRITLDQPPPGNVYCVDYVLAPGAEVADFRPGQPSPGQQPLKDLLQVWRTPGDFFVTETSWKQVPTTVSLRSGQTATLLETAGAGQVHLLVVDMPQATLLGGRALVLRGYWDEEQAPRLELPLGDLAGMGFGLGNPNAPAGVRVGDNTRFYCRLPMPFGKAARLTLTNESPWVMPQVKASVWWDNLPAGAPGYGRLCAYTRRLRPAPDAQELELLKLSGRGHLAGYNMSVWEVNWQQGPLKWYARGYLDGEPEPRYRGAGLLDFNFGARQYMYAGVLAQTYGTVAHDYMWGPDKPGTLRQRVNFYRYMVNDVIRFADSCRVTLQRAPGAASFGQADLTWLLYVDPSTPRWWPPLDPADLPWPVTRSGASHQAEDLAATASVTEGTLSIVPDRWGSFNLDGGAMLSYSARRPGDALTLQITAPERGYYTLNLRQIGSAAAANYNLRRGTTTWRPWWNPVIPTPGKFVAHDPEPWGVWWLEAGPNAFDFVLAPESWQTGTLLSLDSLWLDPASRRTNALEAEHLSVVRTTACRAAPEPLGSKWASGWGMLSLQPTEQGARAVLRVSFDQAQAGALLLLGYRAAPGTRWEALWDGAPLGTVEAGVLPAPFERRLAWFPAPAGTVGDHELTLALEQGTLGLDFLRFADSAVWEAELLPFFTKADFTLVPAARPQDPAPDRNVALRHFSSSPATPLLLGLPAPQAGRYHLAVWVAAEGAKQYQFTLNEAPLPAPAIVPASNVQTRMDLGTVDLRQGLNLLSVGTDGYLRVDAIETSPAG